MLYTRRSCHDGPVWPPIAILGRARYKGFLLLKDLLHGRKTRVLTDLH